VSGFGDVNYDDRDHPNPGELSIVNVGTPGSMSFSDR